MTNLQQIDGYREASLRDYFGALRRQKGLFLSVLVLVPVVAFIVAVSQQPSYQATAEVLITNLSPSADPDRVAQTEVSVARVPAVAAHALAAAKVHSETADDLLAHSSVTARSNADVLDFSVNDHNSSVAQRLVNAYVSEFTAYQAALNAEPLIKSVQDVRAKIAALGHKQAANQGLLVSLRNKETQLETEQEIQDSNVRVLRTATSAGRSAPRPALYVALGLILGFVLGAAVAVLGDALDTRIRSVPEVLETLGLPLLGLIPRGSGTATIDAGVRSGPSRRSS
jgi:uncharacterized protein involved in exopolysaccharide biosynthesis